jgi:diguanylate cyclase (GGDEF)-like protein
MESKQKKSEKAPSLKNATLERVINRNEKIKENVKQAADDLTSINEILRQGKEVESPVQIIREAIAQNKEVECKVAVAADDLHQVNTELVQEVAERQMIETELDDTRNDLSEALDDLVESRTKEEESRETSLHDALTGLPNRVLLMERLDQGLIQAKRHGWKLAVLFLDIDKFKNINDSHGHDAGDRVLLELADRLHSAIREEDTVCRWGGDEFVCLLLEVRADADVVRLAELIAGEVSGAFEHGGTAFSVGVSIGIAMHPGDGDTADILLKNADTAMYEAKGTGRRVVPFSGIDYICPESK